MDLPVRKKRGEGLLRTGSIAPKGQVHRRLERSLVHLLQLCQQRPGLGRLKQLLKIGAGKITVFLKHSIASCSLG